jgi:polyferredoxin
VRDTGLLAVARFAVLCAAIVAALYGVDLLSYAGAYDFFSLTLSVWLVVFTVLVLVSMTIYRPVCRAACPFVFLFSIPAAFSRFRLGRTGACTGCRKCEKACPANVAGPGSPKGECYLCGRCTEVCPVKGALVYRQVR